MRWTTAGLAQLITKTAVSCFSINAQIWSRTDRKVFANEAKVDERRQRGSSGCSSTDAPLGMIAIKGKTNLIKKII